MALQQPIANDRKRVKVYELQNNDWFDRGTGFCTGQIVDDEPRIYVESEDEPDRMLLEARIVKDDGYQKQQDTLIVWTDTNGIDMALSFQEAEGCAVIWDFVHQVQTQLLSLQDDGLSDDAVDGITSSFTLSPPELGNLDEIEQIIRQASVTQGGRETLAKFLIRDEYLLKLIPWVTVAEKMESLPDLHRLCNIMKALILMNDNAIIEHLVTDDIILGVVGALEYDPDFPTHKANHRQYLSDESRYKEVVEIKDQNIKRKIRQTWRLQYLKDVVLARILDDPTFNVLNSLIFFNQVDIVQHLQNNVPFLKELFAIFNQDTVDIKRKEQAVHFLQQCTAIAKTLQAQNRANLLSNFISHGLFTVITFAVKHPSPAMRTTGIDILVALLDHDPNMMRGYMLKAVHEKKTPLTDVLIELLHAETDLGVKNQLADAIKILLDPQPPSSNDHMGGGRPGAEYMTKLTRPPQLTPTQAANEQFAQDNFDRLCRKLFQPLKALQQRTKMSNLTYQEVSLYSYLVEILTFFVRQHSIRSRPFVLSEQLAPRVSQLLKVSQKPLKLTALKFFRTCISLQDQFYATQITKSDAFDALLDIVIETMPRDNLLNSACLELFEFVKKEAMKALILHLGHTCRPKLEEITYVDTFQHLLLRFDQLTTDHNDSDITPFGPEDGTPPGRIHHINGRWHGLQEMDPNEEDYFNTSDDDGDDHPAGNAEQDVFDRMQWHRRRLRSEMPNGISNSIPKPLVDYPEDEEDENSDHRIVTSQQSGALPDSEKENSLPISKITGAGGRRLQPSPEIKSAAELDLAPTPERPAEKRRRQEDEEDDELGKLSSGGSKRRNSSTSSSSVGSTNSVRRKKGFLRSKQAGEPGSNANAENESSTDSRKSKKIAISLTAGSSKADEPASKTTTTTEEVKTKGKT